MIRWILVVPALVLAVSLWLVSCSEGESGTLTGRVVDGFGFPLGGDAVMVILTNNPAINHPDRYGNFIIHAPVGTYEMQILFTNPAAGFKYELKADVDIVQGTRNLGEFTLLNVQNKEAWLAYREKNWQQAIALFNVQASMARSGQLVFLPYMRYMEGEPDQNTLLTQGVLSAENGLGWTYARGMHNIEEARIHYQASLSGGYNNLDAKVGLAGIALSDGEAQSALDYLKAVIDEPGLYDSTQVHDSIREVDLIASRSLAEFLLGYDRDSAETAQSIMDKIESEGSPASAELLAVLESFRPTGNAQSAGGIL
jgi:hypothetical protein